MQTAAVVGLESRRQAHAAWVETLSAWRAAGLARELDPREVGPYLAAPPTLASMGELIAAHYHAQGDVVERAWRSQSDRYLELPDDALEPALLASAVHAILPEARIGVVAREDGIELRLASDERALATTAARVMLRAMERHVRSGVVRSARADRIDARWFVYAVNAMLELRGAPVRFLPLVSPPDRRAWLATTLERALALEDAGTIAPTEPWRDFCRYNDVVLR